jgi:transposase
MAENATFNVTNTDDKSGVHIEMMIDGKALGSGDLDAAELEKLIDLLAHARSALSEEVAEDLEDETRIVPVEDPVWLIPEYRKETGRLLFLRHPGLGWLGFSIPDQEADDIADWLTKDVPLQK